jgi:hypothetical protein
MPQTADDNDKRPKDRRDSCAGAQGGSRGYSRDSRITMISAA